MLSEEPEPNILDLQKLVEALCGHVRAVKDDVTDPFLRKEMADYLATLEEANRRLVPEWAEAQNAYDAATRAVKEQEEELRRSEAEAPAGEDVLPLGLALRSQLLHRYVTPEQPPAAPTPEGEAWEMTTGAFRAAEAESPPPPAPKKPAIRPPLRKEPPAAAGEDVTDLSTGEWRSPE